VSPWITTDDSKQVIRKANDDSVVWSEKTLEAWGRADEAISRASREQHRKLASVATSIEEVRYHACTYAG